MLSTIANASLQRKPAQDAIVNCAGVTTARAIDAPFLYSTSQEIKEKQARAATYVVYGVETVHYLLLLSCLIVVAVCCLHASVIHAYPSLSFIHHPPPIRTPPPSDTYTTTPPLRTPPPSHTYTHPLSTGTLRCLEMHFLMKQTQAAGQAGSPA